MPILLPVTVDTDTDAARILILLGTELILPIRLPVTLLILMLPGY